MACINQRKTHYIAKKIRRDITLIRESGETIGKDTNLLLDMIDDLAVELLKCTPPRNSDVGTPDEQLKRHKETVCLKTVCPGDNDFECKACFAKWMRRPYEESQAKGD